MKGISDISSDESEDIEIFNRRRQGHQGKSCEVGGVLMVLLCLTFFATTIIFGARYVSAMKKIEQLEEQLYRMELGEHANPQIEVEVEVEKPPKLPDAPPSNVTSAYPDASEKGVDEQSSPLGNRTSEQFATNSSTRTLIRRIAMTLLSFTVILHFEKSIA